MLSTRFRSLLPLLVAFAATPFALGCSSDATEEEEAADEGALEGDKLLELVLGEFSKGPTLGEGYKAKRAEEKQAIAWAAATRSDQLRCRLGNRIAGDALVQALEQCPTGEGSDDLRIATVFGTLKSLGYEAFMKVIGQAGLLTPAFDESGDEMKRGRKKILHPFGAIAKVELRVEQSSPYTGVLRAGARVPGIMRQSTGGPEKVMGFVPGIGLKLFTSGGESADFQIMNSPGKQLLADGETTDYNFFSRAFSNEMVKSDDERGAAAIVAKIFSKVHPTPLRVSVDHIGRRAVDGTVEASPSSPNDIVIEPPAELTSAVNAYIAAHPGKDPRVALANATKDATAEQPVLLYRVRVGTATNFQKADPAARDRDFPIVASIVATSAFVPSKFGDSQLYFRHHRGCTPVQEGAKTAVAPSLCR